MSVGFVFFCPSAVVQDSTSLSWLSFQLFQAICIQRATGKLCLEDDEQRCRIAAQLLGACLGEPCRSRSSKKAWHCAYYRIIYLLYIIYMITILYDYIYTYFIILLCIDVYDVLSHWATKQHHLWHNVTALCLCAVCARCWSMRGQRCTLVIPGLRVTASEVLGGSAGSARAEGFQRKKQSSHRHFEIFWDRVHSEAFLFEDCSEAVKIALSKALVCIGLGLDI